MAVKQLFIIALTWLLCITSVSATACEPTVDAPSVLLMEKHTGTTLYEQSAHEKLEPASVTKIMTMLLVMEALDSGRLTSDTVVQASAHACSMGGSQIYLKEGEQMTVGELLKSVAVASANDAAVALAEHLAGSEEAFVSRMNERAAQLGMTNTTFLNCTGLPATGHVTTAYDIALMSRELLLHDTIKEYTTIWLDTVRNGGFQLANTNKLIRFYDGATGLKTGFTNPAMFCLSATAEREGMELIAVILHAETSDKRFETAKSLLNYGFANYCLTEVHPDRALPPIDVHLGTQETVQPVLTETCRLLAAKTDLEKITTSIELTDLVAAPVEQGQILGSMTVYLDGVEQQRIPIVADTAVERLRFSGIFKQFLQHLFMAR